MSKDLHLLELGLDWKLALKRVLKDIRDDFWPDPFGFEDLLAGNEQAQQRIEPLLKSYQPKSGVSYSIPKTNFTIRDSIYIPPLDRLVYQALADHLIPQIDSHLSPSSFSHRFRGPSSKWIFHPGVSQWKKFSEAVKAKLLETKGSWLVVTDLANYFETVRFRFLKRQLEDVLGADKSPSLQRCIDILIECVSVWSPYDGYGLVQNVDASSFLGNVLLDRVDKLMEKDGYPVFRYMDDFQIVVRGEADARKALIRLVSHLREIGLALNSAKTNVLAADSEEMSERLRGQDPDISAIEDAIATKERVVIQGIVERLFAKAQNLMDTGRTGDRIFRFCLNRIASLRAYRNIDLPDSFSLTTGVLRLLVNRPAETDTFCRYLEVAPLNAVHMAELERLLTQEPVCVYAWQNFHLWRLAAQRGLKTSALVQRSHQLIAGDSASPEVAAVALYLGSSGDYADRQAIGRRISAVPPGMVRRCFQIAIQELHKSERSEIYRELADDDLEAGFLSEHLTSLHEPLYVDNPPRVEVEDLPDVMPSVYA